MLEPRSTGAEARRIPLSSLAPLMSSARLLLIDDDARLTGMVGDYLRAAGFEVSTAGSLAAAREALSHSRFELLVLDLMLPGADGLDVCRELRGGERTKDIPVIMLTSPADHAVLPELNALGIQGLLVKPVTEALLAETARKVLGLGPAKSSPS